MRERRCTSARRSAGRSPPSPSRWATSSWVCIDASGLRSSCAASATKARCRSRELASRSSMSLRVTASAWTSSAVSGTGSRSSRPVPLIRAAPARRPSTGPQRAPDHPPRDDREHGQQQGIGDQQRPPQDPLAALDVPDLLGHDHRPGTGPRAHRHGHHAQRPGDPGAGALHRQRLAAPGERQLRRAQQGGQPVGVDRRAHDPAGRVDDLHHLGARHRQRVRQRAGLRHRHHVRGRGAGAAVDGALDGDARARRTATMLPMASATATPVTPSSISRARRLIRAGPRPPRRYLEVRGLTEPAGSRRPVRSAARAGPACGAGSRCRPPPRWGRCPRPRPTRGPAARSC